MSISSLIFSEALPPLKRCDNRFFLLRYSGMKTVFPKPLAQGGEIRVVSLSTSLSVVSKQRRQIAQAHLERLGFKVTYGAHVMKRGIFCSATIEDRLSDFHEALQDPEVTMILAARGGFCVNQLFPYLDFSLIRKSRKIICGHSDLTALVNAVWARAGLVAYLGPNFSTLGMKQSVDYTLEYFARALQQPASFFVQPSKRWGETRVVLRNPGPFTIQSGEAYGTIVGGNLCTFNLLHGTPFMPKLVDAVLWLEDDDLTGKWCAQEFDRNLESVLQQPGAEQIRGLIIGRFQKASKMNRQKITEIIRTKSALKNIPVVAGADFGHTSPQCTLPIGAMARVKAGPKRISLEIMQGQIMQGC